MKQRLGPDSMNAIFGDVITSYVESHAGLHDADSDSIWDSVSVENWPGGQIRYTVSGEARCSPETFAAACRRWLERRQPAIPCREDCFECRNQLTTV